MSLFCSSLSTLLTKQRVLLHKNQYPFIQFIWVIYVLKDDPKSPKDQQLLGTLCGSARNRANACHVAHDAGIAISNNA